MAIQSPISKHVCTVSTLGGGRVEEGGVEGNGEERKQKGEGVSEAHFLVIIILSASIPNFSVSFILISELVDS